MIYTPAASGDFYPVVTEINDNRTGTYTLSVIVLGANGASEADTDFPTSRTTSGRVEVGASATGNIGIANDYDWFRVDLEAGKIYPDRPEGHWWRRRHLGKHPYLLNIRDSSGTEIDGTENDDVDPSNDIYDSQTVYTPTAAGTYYLVAASGETGGTGTYTLSVRDLTQPPPCTLNTGDIWCGVMTVGELKTNADVLLAHGFSGVSGLSAGALVGNPDDTMFSVGDNDYTIQGVYIQVPTAAHLTGTLIVLLAADLSDDDRAGLVLTVDDTTFTFEFSRASKGTTGQYSWGQSGLDWSSATTVTLRLRGAPAGRTTRPGVLPDIGDARGGGEQPGGHQRRRGHSRSHGRRQRRHADLLHGWDGRGLLRLRRLDPADHDDHGRDLQLRGGAEQLLGDGEGVGRHGQRRACGDDQPDGRRHREICQAGQADAGAGWRARRRA